MSIPDPTALARQAEQATALRQNGTPNEHHKMPPVETWNPPLSGDMDIRIARDGTWYHQGSPIHRTGIVRLFSTILRREEDGNYYLLTPVEKWRIRVDDAPFVAVLLDVVEEDKKEQQTLVFQTNTGECIAAGADHLIEVEYRDSDQPSPYVQVRGRLRALMARAVFLQLAELAVEGAVEDDVDARCCLGVWSQGLFFPLGPAEE